MRRRQDDISGLILISCVDVHVGLDPPPPSTCVHLSLTPSPLRVDVINGWPHTGFLSCDIDRPYVCLSYIIGKEIFDISRVCVCVSACVCMHVFMYVCIKV